MDSCIRLVVFEFLSCIYIDTDTDTDTMRKPVMARGSGTNSSPYRDGAEVSVLIHGRDGMAPKTQQGLTQIQKGHTADSLGMKFGRGSEASSWSAGSRGNPCHITLSVGCVFHLPRQSIHCKITPLCIEKH